MPEENALLLLLQLGQGGDDIKTNQHPIFNSGFHLFMGNWAQIPKFKFTCKRGHGLETSHKVVYTVGAVAAAYELYSSVTKATELTKRLQRLKDSSGEERS